MLLSMPDILRIVKHVYFTDMQIPNVEIPIEWAYTNHDEASDAVTKMASDELAKLTALYATKQPATFKLVTDGEHEAVIHMTADGLWNDRPITEYDIYHVERKEFYDENSKKRYYWKYRDMKIYPNKKNNRFRVYDEMGFKFLRHSLDAALTGIDTFRLTERIRHHG